MDQKDLKNFKNIQCDENSIIRDIISRELKPYFTEPVLDVGSSMGDILIPTIPEIRTIHIDVDKIENPKNTPKGHTFLQTNFYDYLGDVGTLFMAHVLQYIDDDPIALNKKVASLNPDTIITVTNRNDDFLGKFISFLEESDIPHNAEVRIPSFPQGYQKVKSTPFTASFKAKTLEELFSQLMYVIFDIRSLDQRNRQLAYKFVEAELSEPQITLNQSIDVYQRA